MHTTMNRTVPYTPVEIRVVLVPPKPIEANILGE